MPFSADNLASDATSTRPPGYQSLSSATPTRAIAAPLVLVVDDDPGIRETMEWGLAHHGFGVLSAGSGAEAIALASQQQVDCLLIDLRLPDMMGTDLVRTLRRESVDAPFILISGVLTVPVVVEAMRLGAHDVMEKPCDIEEVIAMIDSILKRGTAPHHTEAPAGPPSTEYISPRSVAARWAGFVLKLCESEGDSKTIAEWSRIVGVSYSSLCETCRILGIRPHDARDFARVLRALTQASRFDCAPEALLDVSDRRTLSVMLRRAGVMTTTEFRTYRVSTFLRSQTFIAPDCEGIKLIKLMLRGTS